MADRPDVVNQHRSSVVCGVDRPPADGEESPFDDRWRTEAVVGLAVGIRADQAFDRMPILADALEEAGCDDRVILDHCRACDRHVTGCWVLEAVVNTDARRPVFAHLHPTVSGRVLDGMREELRLTNWFRVRPAASVVPTRERHWARLGCVWIQTVIFCAISILVLWLFLRLFSVS